MAKSSKGGTLTVADPPAVEQAPKADARNEPFLALPLPALPSLSDYPEWRHATAKMGELGRTASELRQQLAAVEDALAEERRRTSSLDAKVEHLVQTGEFIAPDQGLAAEHLALRQKLEVAERACEVFQANTIQALRNRLSYQICKSIWQSSECRAFVAEFRDLIDRLEVASAAGKRFVNACAARGVSEAWIPKLYLLALPEFDPAPSVAGTLDWD